MQRNSSLVFMFLAAIIALISKSVVAEPPATVWSHALGGGGYDDAIAVFETNDNAYIVGGSTSSLGSGDLDYWLFKLNSNGDTIWSKTFGGVDSDQLTAMCSSPYGGYFLAGRSSILNGQLFVVRTNDNGDSLWGGYFEDGGDYFQCHSVAPSNDGGFVLVGYIWPLQSIYAEQPWVMKIDANGDSLWSRLFDYGTQGIWGELKTVESMNDGGFLVGGLRGSPYGAFLMRLDINGDSLWSRVYRVESGFRECQDIAVLENGENLLACNGYTDVDGTEVRLIRTNSMGDSLWSRQIEIPNIGGCGSFLQADDGGYVMTGWVTDSSGENDSWVGKVDEEGFTLWTTLIHHAQNDYMYDISGSPENGYLVVGRTEAGVAGTIDAWLAKTAVDSVSPVLNVHSPDGGEQWPTWTYQSVQWLRNEEIPLVRIDLNRDFPSGDWETLRDSTLNDGVEQVWVSGSLSNNCRIRISDVTGRNYGQSNSNFSVTTNGVFSEAPSTYLQEYVRGPNGQRPRFYDTKRLEDGSIVACGIWIGGYGKAALLKFSPEGDTVWTRSYELYGSDDATVAYSFDTLEDGGFILAGAYRQGWYNDPDPPMRFNYLLIKTDSLGQVLWTEHWGSVRTDIASFVSVDEFGGYTLIGMTESAADNSFDVSVIRLDSVGNVLSSVVHGSAEDKRIIRVRELGTNKFVAVGVQRPNNYSYFSLWAAEYDSLGLQQWTHSYGGSAPSTIWGDGLNDIVALPDSSLVAVGGVNETYPIVLHLSKTGAELSRTIYSRPSSHFRSVMTKQDHSLIVSGTWSEDHGYLAAIDTNYQLQWEGTYGPFDVNSGFDDFTITSDGRYFCLGRGDTSFVTITDIDFSGKGIWVLAPQSTDVWSINSIVEINWLSNSIGSEVNIYINRSYPEGDWSEVILSTPNDGEFSWLVSGPVTNSARIRVVSTTDPAFGDTSGTIVIEATSGYLAIVENSGSMPILSSWNTGELECPDSKQIFLRFKNLGGDTVTIFQTLEPPSAEFTRNSLCGETTLAPGSTSSCVFSLEFLPTTVGSFSDTFVVVTNAGNAPSGLLRLPLTGTQIGTPESPEVVLSTVGNNAILRWSPIVESIGHCQIDPPSYLVFFSEDPEGPFWYHGGTNDTTYTHVWAIQHTAAMFYHVYAVQTEPGLLAMLPDRASDALLSEAEVWRRLMQTDKLEESDE